MESNILPPAAVPRWSKPSLTEETKVNFNFTVSQMDAENILSALQNEYCCLLEARITAVVGKKTEEANSLAKHAEYFKQLVTLVSQSTVVC